MLRCQLCGQFHGKLPLAIAYRRPPEYFRLDESEREERIRCTDELCSLDDREFLIRGVLELPLAETESHFEWGLWACVPEASFFDYVERWRDQHLADAPPFHGRLTGGPKPYPDSDGLDLLIHLRPNGQFPRFEVVSETHPLGIDQRLGITTDLVHSFAEICLPDTFAPR